MVDYFDSDGSKENRIESVAKEHYVYELYDRDTGVVFYVGEGVRDRALHHMKESERIRQKISSDPSLDGRLGSAKTNRIQELLSERIDRLGVRVVGRFDSKEAALAVEAVLINWVYGKNYLTNISRGRGATFVRPKENPMEELIGIDIERKLRVFGKGGNTQTTGYLKQKIENHERYGHVAMAEEIYGYLCERFPKLQIDEPCFWESGRYVAVFVTLVPNSVRMIIQLTDSAKNQHVYNLKAVSEASADVERFKGYMRKNHQEIQLMNNNRYCKLPAWSALKVDNISLDEVVEQVHYAQRFLDISDNMEDFA
jgi:hypothetical protein